MTQQALSGRIRSLEEVVGVPVIVRSTTGSSLTEAGALIASSVEELPAAADRLDEGIRSLAGDRPAWVRVAASQTIAEALLPRWLLALRADESTAGLPATLVELVTHNSIGVVDRVRRGAADLGFIETPLVPADLDLDALGTDELVAVVAAAHPWTTRDAPVPLKELARATLVVREEGSGTRDALEQIVVEQLGVSTAAPAIELGTTAAVRSAVLGGVAPGMLSRLLVRDDLVLGRLVAVPIEGAPLVRPLHAVRPRGRVLPAAQRPVDRAAARR